jgi:hypothetical protein
MCNLIGINVQGNAVFKLPGLTIVASLHAIALAAAQPVCLPASVFVKNANEEFPVIDLGYIDNVLTLCAYQRALDPNVDKLLGCWTVNSTTAALGASAATAIPGRGRHKRITSYAPCTKDQFDQWTRSEDPQTGACERVLDAEYKPYVDMSPVQLPSGDIITTLSGPAQGYIAVLSPAGLTERHRLKLARCP